MLSGQRLTPAQRPPQRPASAATHRPASEHQFAHGGQAALSTGAGEGVDQLWRFQLRKENQAVFTKLESIKMAMEAHSADANRQLQDAREQVAAFGTKISNLESDLKKDKQIQSHLMEGHSALKRKLDAFVEKMPMSGRFHLHN